MSDAQRQRTQGGNGALQDAESGSSSADARALVAGAAAASEPSGMAEGGEEQSLGLEDVKFEPANDGPGAAAADSASRGSSTPQAPAAGNNGSAPKASASGSITVHVVGRTDVGLVREHNEDNFLLADLATGSRDPSTFHEVPSAGLVLGVCDGMGGAAAGEVASQMAVDTVFEMMRRSVPAADRDALARALMRSIEEAGARIFEAARADRSRRGMGTTSTVATLMDKTLFVGQVGDSRAYVLRNTELKQVTKDQSLVNQLIEAGQLTEDEAEAFEHSNIILQALGTTEQVSVDLTFLELRRGDRLLMCSDGLSGLVHGDVIREVMVEYQDLNACCERLIELAKAGGGHDNVTVILADFNGDGLAPTQPGDLAGYQQYPLPLEDMRSAGQNSDVPTIAPPSGRPDSEKSGYQEFGDFDGRAGSSGGSSLRYIFLVLVLVAIAGAYYYWNGHMRQASSGQPPHTPVVTPVTPEPPTQVEVVVRTDVEGGELLVDGEPFGAPGGDRWVLDLLPGPHKLEVRSGGNAVTTSLVTVREGVPATVLLSMPEGSDSSAKVDAGAAAAAATDGKRKEREHRHAKDAPSEDESAAATEGDDTTHRSHRKRREAAKDTAATGETPAADVAAPQQ